MTDKLIEALEAAALKQQCQDWADAATCMIERHDAKVESLEARVAELEAERDQLWSEVEMLRNEVECSETEAEGWEHDLKQEREENEELRARVAELKDKERKFYQVHQDQAIERNQLRDRVAELEIDRQAAGGQMMDLEARVVFDAAVVGCLVGMAGETKGWEHDLKQEREENEELRARVEELEHTQAPGWYAEVLRGRAAVVPLSIPAEFNPGVGGELIELLYVDDKLLHTNLLLRNVRLDKPVEDKP